MTKSSKQLFEVDRKMELRMRLAAKQANHGGKALPVLPVLPDPPEREVLDRLIKKVRVL
ncbi:MAG: hypothetical protein JXA97_13640 [Anaerolineales bacterium]|nr:hypothetical protein [Anaerolineales bacterium]